MKNFLQSFKYKFVPPYAFALAVILEFTVYFTADTHILFGSYGVFFAFSFLIVGIVLIRWTFNELIRKKTNTNTFDTPQQLLTSGPFALSRNPIYFGYGTILFGLTILIWHMVSAFIFLLFVLVLNHWYVRCEERNIRAKFGQEYCDYLLRVRRWL